MLTRRQFSKLIFGSGVLVSSNLGRAVASPAQKASPDCDLLIKGGTVVDPAQNLHEPLDVAVKDAKILEVSPNRSEEHTSELQSRQYLVCRLLLEKKNSKDSEDGAGQFTSPA